MKKSGKKAVCIKQMGIISVYLLSGWHIFYSFLPEFKKILASLQRDNYRILRVLIFLRCSREAI
ncbi:MAG: hypothetical protein DBY16_00200 [Coprobacter sp.]|nr:MAG: hypothetical protein DBY16_00200 [Coprobacter sp.]